MTETFNTAWTGFGWGQDIQVEGARSTDLFSFAVHRVREGGLTFTWRGGVDGDGTLRIRASGAETARWTPGVFPTSITIERDGAAGVLPPLPSLTVKTSNIPPSSAVAPMVSDLV